MDIITKANQEKFKEVSNMCEALEEILEEVMKGKSLEQIADELEEIEESILPLYKQVKKELSK